jgi:hypothetical protein
VGADARPPDDQQQEADQDVRHEQRHREEESRQGANDQVPGQHAHPRTEQLAQPLGVGAASEIELSTIQPMPSTVAAAVYPPVRRSARSLRTAYTTAAAPTR